MRRQSLFLLIMLLMVASCNLPSQPGEDVFARDEVEASQPDARIQPGEMLPYTSMNPPDQARISITEPDAEEFVLVTGDAGAVPTRGDRTFYSRVALFDMEAGSEACVELNSDGSFKGRVYAPPGTTLYIAPILREWQELNDPESEWGLCQSDQQGDGVLVHIPNAGESESHASSYITYGALRGGRIRKNGEYGAYTMRENYWVARGDSSQVDITVRGLDPNVCLQPRLKIERLFDAEGRPRGAVSVNTQGIPVTPTGFMVETQFHNLDADFIYLQDDCLRGWSDYDLSYEIPDVTEYLPEGWYRRRIVLGGWGDWIDPFKDGPPSVEGYDLGLYGPLFPVGDPVTPTIPWVLFAETASQAAGGVRGIVPLELKDDFAFDSRVAFTTAAMILPRTDPASGAVVPYRLEPWLPSIASAPFRGALPTAPLLPLWRFPAVPSR